MIAWVNSQLKPSSPFPALCDTTTIPGEQPPQLIAIDVLRLDFTLRIPLQPLWHDALYLQPVRRGPTHQMVPARQQRQAREIPTTTEPPSTHMDQNTTSRRRRRKARMRTSSHFSPLLPQSRSNSGSNNYITTIHTTTP